MGDIATTSLQQLALVLAIVAAIATVFVLFAGRIFSKSAFVLLFRPRAGKQFSASPDLFMASLHGPDWEAFRSHYGLPAPEELHGSYIKTAN